MDGAVLTGWFVGYVIGAVVIVVVVVLVAVTLSVARRIGVQAQDLVGALIDIKVATEPLPAVATLNERLGSVAVQAVAARQVLTGEMEEVG